MNDLNDDVQEARSKMRHPSSEGHRADPNMFREHRVHVARKDHECEDCGEPIKRGTTYDLFVTPAWQDYEIDCDSEGRSVAILRDRDERRWATHRYHPACFEKRYWR